VQAVLALLVQHTLELTEVIQYSLQSLLLAVVVVLALEVFRLALLVAQVVVVEILEQVEQVHLVKVTQGKQVIITLMAVEVVLLKLVVLTETGKVAMVCPLQSQVHL
jgi:hypothetical protein